MRAGGGKAKGSGFERKICKELSLWVTRGKKKDVFWRSAMSGGRATVHGKSVRQAGDIAAVAPEGHCLTDHFIIECKHLKAINLAAFIMEGSGQLQAIWKKLLIQCKLHDRMPMLIVKKNNTNTIVVTHRGVQKHARCTVASHTLEIGLFRDLVRQKPPN